MLLYFMVSRKFQQSTIVKINEDICLRYGLKGAQGENGDMNYHVPQLSCSGVCISKDLEEL